MPINPPPAIHTAADLHHARHLAQTRLKQTWERIFTRFSRDFSGIADEIDPLTGALLVDNGHLRSLASPSPSPSSDSEEEEEEEEKCRACADRDELDDSPCHHHHHQTPTRAHLLAWRPAQLHAHLAPLTDTADLAHQLQRNAVGGRALHELSMTELRARLALRGTAVWAEIRRLQRILSDGGGSGPKGDSNDKDAWAPPPRALDPFYSHAWHDEHPDGTPAAFCGKRARDGDDGGGGKRVKVLRVGTGRAGVEVGTRAATFEVAIPPRRRDAAPAVPATPGDKRATTPAAKTKTKTRKTPAPSSSSSRKSPAENSTRTPTPASASAVKTPAVKRPTPTPATKIPAIERPTRTPVVKTPAIERPTRTPVVKTPAVKTPAVKTPATKRAPSTTPKPTSARAPTPAAAVKTPATKRAPSTTPKPTSARAPTPAAAVKTPATKTPGTKTPAVKTPTVKTPVVKTPSTKTPVVKASTVKRTPKPTPTPTPKPTKKSQPQQPTSKPPTPGWTATINRARLRGHSFARYTAAAAADDEDELASPAPAVAVAVAKERTPTPTPTPAAGTQVHTCAGARGFCFVCLDREGSEDRLG